MKRKNRVSIRVLSFLLLGIMAVLQPAAAYAQMVQLYEADTETMSEQTEEEDDTWESGLTATDRTYCIEAGSDAEGDEVTLADEMTVNLAGSETVSESASYASAGFSSTSSTITLTYSQNYYFYTSSTTNWTTKFWVDDDYLAYCAAAQLNTPSSGDYTVYSVSVTDSGKAPGGTYTRKAVLAALITCYDGAEYETYGTDIWDTYYSAMGINGGGSSAINKYIFSHLVISYLMGYGTYTKDELCYGLTTADANRVAACAEEVADWAADDDNNTVISWYKEQMYSCAGVYTGGSSYVQTIVWVEDHAYITLSKSGDGSHSLYGALYGVYDENNSIVGYFMTGGSDKDSVAGYVATTSSSGAATTDYSATYNGRTYYRTSTKTMSVKPGKYYVKELVAPYTGYYVLDTSAQGKWTTLKAEETISFAVEDSTKPYLTLTKKGGDGTHSLRGALFRVSDADGNTVGYFITRSGTTTATGYVATTDYDEADENYRDTVAVTGSSGTTYYPTTSTKMYVDPGTYYVTEVYAPMSGYYTKQSGATASQTVSAGGSAVFTLTDSIHTTEVRIRKRASIDGEVAFSSAVLTDNGAYRLSGAVFVISTSKSTSSSAVVATLTTGSDGYTDYVTLEPGTYYYKEISASDGYTAASGWTEFTVSPTTSTSATQTLTCYEKANPWVPDLDLYKVDQDGNVIAQEGFLFKLVYTRTDSDGNAVTRTYIYETDENGHISFSDPEDLYDTYMSTKSWDPAVNEDGQLIFFAGSITISEYAVPEGSSYALSSEELLITLSVSDTADISASYSGSYSTEAASGTICWVNEKGGLALFKQAEDADTDTNLYSLAGALYGIYDSEGLLIGCFITGDDGTGYVASQDMSEAADGALSVSYEDVTYYATDETVYDDLDIGSYTVTELAAPASGYYLLDETVYTVEVTEDNLSTIQYLSSSEPFVPEICTELLETSSGTHYANTQEALTLTDTVTYENVSAGDTYVIRGVLYVYDKEADAVGEAVAEGSVTWTPEETSGSVSFEYALDTETLSDLAGKTVVSFISLYDETGAGDALVTHEETAETAGQWVTFNRTHLIVYKMDTSSGKTEYLEGASFELYDENGSLVASFTTDADGSSGLITDLDVGIYTLVETEAPEGYLIDDTEHVIAITEDDIGTTVVYTTADTTIPVLYSSGGIGIYVFAAASLLLLAFGLTIVMHKAR